MTKKLVLATLALLMTACGSGTSGDTSALTLSLVIPEEYVDPSVVPLIIKTTSNVALTKLTIERNDKDDNNANYKLLKTVTSAPYSFTYSDTIPGSGTYTYRVSAQDAAGRSLVNTLKVSAKVPTPLTSLTGTLVESASAFAYPLSTKAWSGGAGQVMLTTAGAPSSEVTRGALDASGKFTLDLTAFPSAAQKVPATPQNLMGATGAACTGDAASSSSAVGMTMADLQVANKTGVAAPFLWLAPITVGQTKNSQLSLSKLIYVDQAVKFSGSLTCTLGAGKDPVTVSMPLHLYKGWNKATVQTVSNSAGQLTSAAWSADFPAETNNQWLLLPSTIQTAP